MFLVGRNIFFRDIVCEPFPLKFAVLSCELFYVHLSSEALATKTNRQPTVSFVYDMDGMQL